MITLERKELKLKVKIKQTEAKAQSILEARTKS